MPTMMPKWPFLEETGCAPGGNRTPDPLLRRQDMALNKAGYMAYPPMPARYFQSGRRPGVYGAPTSSSRFSIALTSSDRMRPIS